MNKGKKLFESEDFDKQKKLFTSDDFDKLRESTDGKDFYNNGANEGDDIPTGNNAGKISGGKIIIVIVAVAVLLGGIYFFGIRNNGSDVNGDTTLEQVAQADKTAKSETLDETNANGESTAVNAETAKPSEAEKTPTATDCRKVSAPAKVDENKTDRHSTNEAPSAQPPAKPSLSKQTNTTSQEVSATINGDVEENARRVIRGDFGNGQTRKDKLGTSYSEVQGRVNEMYRQGLVH